MRAGLRERLPDECCIFGDVMDVFGGGHMLNRFLSIPSYQEKLDFASELPLYSTSYCYQHGQRCPINTGAAARMGGLPCQDYSAAGKQRKVQGPNYPCTLGFSYKSSLANNSIIGIECVPRLPRDVPVDAFRHDNVTWLLEEVLEPHDLGFENIARPRLLTCKGYGFWFEAATSTCFPGARLFMGAVSERMATCTHSPTALLEYFKHSVKRDKPLRLW